MTMKDKGHFSNKHPQGFEAKPEIIEAVKEKVQDQKLSCATAFGIAKDQNVEPKEIGMALDVLEISISKCQLGLFGYGPAKKAVELADNVSKDLEEIIRGALTNERLLCKDAWEIADRLGMKKMDVTSACEALSIKISSCQLGAF